MKLQVSLGLLTFCMHLSAGARILAVFPFPSKSHNIFASVVVKTLATRGHQVVEFSPYPPKTPIPNLKHVELHTRFEHELDNWTYEDFIKHASEFDRNMYGFKIRRVWDMNREVCEDTFKDENIQQLLKSNSKFDLVLTESIFGEESLLAFGHRFSAPTVTLETFIPWCLPNWIAGNSLSLASVPDLFSDAFDNELMTFKNRVLNVVSAFLTLWNYHHSHLPFHDQLVQKYFPHSPSVSAMVNNVSLALVNSHPTVVNYIQPYTPNIVPVGGLHISPDRTPLPKDIQSFLDGAKEGFIYFSLGTVVPTHTFPKEVLNIFMNTFKRLSLKVLWKINLDKLDNTPRNVKIVNWVPQITVLEHPNCQLFITHGGLFSHHEAMYAGVPTIGMPFFADQPYNLQYNVIRGKSVRLNFPTLDETKLHSAITTVLSNPRYKESAVRLSKIYRDQPMSPLDRAAFWVEYVLRHEGAHHLKPASLNLSWYQLLLLDVFGVILVAFLIVLVTVYTIVKLLLTFVFGGKKQNKVPPTKKKN